MKKIAHQKDAHNARGRLEIKILQKFKNQGLLEDKSPYEIKQIISSLLDEQDPSDNPQAQPEEIKEESDTYSLVDEVMEVKDRIRYLDDKLEEAIKLSQNILQSIRMNASILRGSPLRLNTNISQLRMPDVKSEHPLEIYDSDHIHHEMSSELGTIDTSYKYKF